MKLHYRDERWPEGRVVPYQIELDNGVLIYAPQDSDSLIRADYGTVDLGNGAEIHVCQAGPCKRAGGEAVLLEIEELARSVGGVVVQSSGCLGNCSNAPNALLVNDTEEERIFAKICDLPASADVVEQATGRAPSMDDPEMVARLQRARRLRIRMEAREESKWNIALSGLADDVVRAESEEDRAELVQEHAELLAAAGFGDKALEVLSSVAPPLEALSLDDIPGLRLLLDQAKILKGLGRVSAIEAFRRRVEQLTPRDARETSIRSQVVQLLVEMVVEVPIEAVSSGPGGKAVRVQDYARWRVHAVTPVSKHSAVYHFRSDDASRGTPIRKGRGGRTVWSKTWHTTLLAEVGEARNAEGPLPWIERDYTPISTAHEWEQGRCDILIKVYLEPAGLATEWLHHLSAAAMEAAATKVAGGDAAAGGAVDGTGAAGAGAMVWLSKPMKTLHVPSLAADEKYINRKHASILLLVAGTGVVAVPQVGLATPADGLPSHLHPSPSHLVFDLSPILGQVLHHAHKATCFGGRSPPVTQPVSVIYSCRSDDALLVPELAGFCRDGALARCTLMVTASQPIAAPFPDVADVDVAAAFSELGNAICVNARLSVETLRAELSLLAKPLRVVVSGPEGFNAACKTMLKQIDDDLGAEAVTVLSA